MADLEKSAVPLQNPEPSAPRGNASQPTTQPAAPQPHVCLDQAHYQDVQVQMHVAPVPMTAYPRPLHSSPTSFLPLVIISLIICGVLSSTSLGLGIPALILSTLSVEAIQKNLWKKANRFGRIAFYITIFNWVYVLFVYLSAFAISYMDLLRY